MRRKQLQRFFVTKQFFFNNLNTDSERSETCLLGCTSPSTHFQNFREALVSTAYQNFAKLKDGIVEDSLACLCTSEKLVTLLARFVRRMLKMIFDGVMWKRRTMNNKVEQLHDEPSIQQVTKAGRARWARHFVRMLHNNSAKMMFTSNPAVTRRNCATNRNFSVSSSHLLSKVRVAWNEVQVFSNVTIPY